MRPLFLLSLPRAGSTLVQRVLGAHPEIHTVSEPWLLLPHVYATRHHGIRAEYWQESACEAIGDFQLTLAGGPDTYRQALREFALTLYRAAGESEPTYFLDKTPHYHAIADDLAELFPDARFVILWRNPLSVLASLLTTFRDSRFEPYLFDFDLASGVANLTAFAEHSEGRAHAVRYEDLVGPSGEDHWRALFAYLDLTFDADLLRGYVDVEFQGRYGDMSSWHLRKITSENRDKWKLSVRGRVRQAWCRRWLRGIGVAQLRTMGYDLDTLLAELEMVPARGSGIVDLVHLATSLAEARVRAAALSIPDSPRPRGGSYERRRNGSDGGTSGLRHADRRKEVE